MSIIHRGFAYLFWDGSGYQHLYVVLNDPTEDGEVIVVNFSSLNTELRKQDTTVVVEPHEHPWLTVRSVVFYKKAETKCANELSRRLQIRAINRQSDVSSVLLERICDGFLQSKHTPIRMKEVYRRIFGIE